MRKFDCEEFSPAINTIKRLNVILDLDNTIINSLSISSELKKVPQDYQNKFKYHDMGNEYRIFERPYVQEFLDYLFIHFNVSIFTAADKDYALFIYDNVIKKPNPERQIHYMFSGYHSSLSEILYNSPKNLKLLWDEFKIHQFKPCNTIIVDDLYEVYIENRYNCVRAPKFELLTKNRVNYNSHLDNFLITKAIKDIEKYHLDLLNKPCLTHIQDSNSFKCNRITF